MSKYTTLLNNIYGKVNINAIATKSFQDVIDSDNVILSILSHTGIAGFKFHIPEREQITMNNQITNHYLENNEPAQDHIANEPIKITLQGYQGEYFYPIHKLEAMAAKVIPSMALIAEMMPQTDSITKQVKIAKLEYEKANINIKSLYDNLPASNLSIVGQEINKQVSDSVINANKLTNISEAFTNNFNGVDLFSIFQNLYKLKSPQTRAFYFLEALWKNKMTFSVETSWKRYDNMAIINVTPTRDKNLDITDFRVTLQQINRTYSLTMSAEAAGRTSLQKAEMVDKGTDKGIPVI